MKQELIELQPKLIETGKEVAETLVVVARETAEAEAKKEVVMGEEAVANEKAAAAKAIKDECEGELAVAMPLLEAALSVGGGNFGVKGWRGAECGKGHRHSYDAVEAGALCVWGGVGVGVSVCVRVRVRACVPTRTAAPQWLQQTERLLRPIVPKTKMLLRRALNTLSKNDITEVKAMKSPPAAVKLVMEAVCHMLGVKPARVNDPNKPGAKMNDFWGPSQVWGAVVAWGSLRVWGAVVACGRVRVWGAVVAWGRVRVCGRRHVWVLRIAPKKPMTCSGSWNHGAPGASVSGASVYGASVSGASVSGASVSGASVSGASVYGASVFGASVSGASVSGACVSGASVSGASVYGASVSGASVSGASVSGASVSGASVSGASVSGMLAGQGKLSGADAGRPPSSPPLPGSTLSAPSKQTNKQTNK
eukprot:365382-Chlamydomonas_euryale.AAC.3